MVYVSHVDYKKLVQEHGKRCADPECGKKGKKPASEFNVARDRYDGLQAYCRECSRARQRASRAKEPKEQAKARKQRFKEKHPEAPTVYSSTYRRRKKAKAKAAKNEKLREAMDLGDKLYAVPQSLCGSSLGSRTD